MTIKEEFEKTVYDLVNTSTKDLLPYEVRKQQVEDLTEDYFLKTGKRYSNSFFLDLLGTYLLADVIRDKRVHKVKLDEYPVLSFSQQQLRFQKEVRVGDQHLDHIVLKEVKNHPNSFKAKSANKDDETD